MQDWHWSQKYSHALSCYFLAVVFLSQWPCHDTVTMKGANSTFVAMATPSIINSNKHIRGLYIQRYDDFPLRAGSTKASKADCSLPRCFVYISFWYFSPMMDLCLAVKALPCGQVLVIRSHRKPYKRRGKIWRSSYCEERITRSIASPERPQKQQHMKPRPLLAWLWFKIKIVRLSSIGGWMDQLNRQNRLHYNSLFVVFNFSRKLLDKKPETSKYKFVTADLRHIIYLFCIKHLCLRCRGERAFISILHSSLGVNAMLALWIESVKQMHSEVVLAMGAAYMRSPENVTLGHDAGNACATWHGLCRCGPMQGLTVTIFRPCNIH